MRNFTKSLLALALMFVCVGGAKATKLDLSFSAEFYCNSTWNAETHVFTWGNKAGRESWMSDDWTFIAVSGLSGDLSSWTKLHLKLTEFTNSVDGKLTLYFKENKGNTQSMDYVAKLDLVPDASGEVDIDLTAFDWKNNANPSETIDNTNIVDVTIYGGDRTDNSESGSVKITDAYLFKPSVAPAAVDGKLIKEVDFTSMSTYEMWHAKESENAYSISLSEKKLVIEKEAAGENWRTQYFVADGASTNKGANYLVRVTMKGSVAGNLVCVFGDWDNTRSTTLNFGTEEEAVDVVLKDFPATIKNAVHVLFQSGAYAGTISISNVKVYELAAVDTYGLAICTKDFTNPSDQFIYWKNDDAPVPAYDDEDGMSITVAAAAANFWEYQYNVAQATTEDGKDYIIHANLKGTKGANLHWSFGNYPNTVSGAFAVTTDWQTIELMCAAVPYTGTSDLAIQVGDYVATLYVKDVTICPAAEGRLIIVGDAGFTTFSANKALNMRGVTAYAAKYNGSKIVLTPVTDVPANTGVVVEAAKDNYKVPVIESAADLSSVNDLQVSDGTATGDGTHVFALGKKDDKVGFVKVKLGVVIPAGKAYLYIATPPTSRDFIGFGDDTTGIESVEQATKVDNQYFNLAGQRVAQPTKGLYIVNGKKVIIK